MTLAARSAGHGPRNTKPESPTSELIRYGFGRTSIAAILVALSDKGVVAIVIREHPGDDALVAALRARFPRAELQRERMETKEAVETVIGFVESPRGDLAMPLDIRGTEFQRRVWAAVMKIPFAKTTTFAEIACEVGAPQAVRAVGNACSQNPLEFVIPCHRVLRSDGSYSGGSQWGDRRQSTMVRREIEWSAAHKPRKTLAGYRKRTR
jgi:AraC family transcriptional regulator of adaptative response/methylated-DNA-[protein]-cysteine methyltransferase